MVISKEQQKELIEKLIIEALTRQEPFLVKEGDEDMVTDLARGSKGEDREGYRAEFIRMVKMADLKVGAK